MQPILIIYLIILVLCFSTGILFATYYDKKYKLLLIYIGVNLFIELLGGYYMYFSNQKLTISHIYNYQAIFELIFLGGYCKLLLENGIHKTIITITTVVVSAFYLYIEFYLKQNTIANFQYFTISNFVFVIISILSLQQLLKEEDIISNPNFWVVTGVLFFNAGFFFLTGFINFIAANNLGLARKLFNINHLLNIIYYSLITYGFICQRRLAKS